MTKAKCFYCNEIFDRDKEPFVKVGARRYAHLKCAQSDDNKLVKEQEEKDEFFQVVKSIFGKEYNFKMIETQALTFIEKYGYTWSGMAKCLNWFYKINNGSIENGHGGIGIIPYVWDEVYKYYYDIYNIQEKNKKIELRAPVIKFNIQSPRAWQQPPHLLNLEDIGNEDT